MNNPQCLPSPQRKNNVVLQFLVCLKTTKIHNLHIHLFTIFIILCLSFLFFEHLTKLILCLCFNSGTGMTNVRTSTKCFHFLFYRKCFKCFVFFSGTKEERIFFFLFVLVSNAFRIVCSTVFQTKNTITIRRIHASSIFLLVLLYLSS